MHGRPAARARALLFALSAAMPATASAATDDNPANPSTAIVVTASKKARPIALIADAMRDCSRRGEIVLDGFGGSGSTLIAAEKTGRSARLLEYDTQYCDTIIRRLEGITGKKARLAEFG